MIQRMTHCCAGVFLSQSISWTSILLCSSWEMNLSPDSHQRPEQTPRDRTPQSALIPQRPRHPACVLNLRHSVVSTGPHGETTKCSAGWQKHVGPYNFAMQKTQTESQNPVIKIELMQNVTEFAKFWMDTSK